MSTEIALDKDLLNDRILATVDKARRLLAEAKDASQAKKIVDMAHAAKVYAKRQQLAEETKGYAHAVMIDATCLLGEFLRHAEKNSGAKGSTVTGSKRVPVKDTAPTLAESGITKKESSTAQKLAELKVKAPEALEAVRQRKTTVKQALKDMKQADLSKELKQAAPISCTTDDLRKVAAMGKQFGTIYADPPWQYSNQATRASTDNHYPTMTVDQLCDLPIKDLAADQAHLHLWTTNAFLFECPRILEAWGFEYKSVFVWVKPQMGIGNYWRVAHEFLVLGVRGGLSFLNHSLPSWLQADRVGHSIKPPRVRQMIQEASPGPRLELFGREPVDGWTVWGNQILRGLFDKEIAQL